MLPYILPEVQGPTSQMTLTTTLTNIPQMSVNLAPGGWYLVNAWIRFGVTVTTGTTVGFSLGGTASTVAPTAFRLSTRNAANDGANTQVSAAVPGAATGSNSITTTGTFACIIDGLVVVGTTGGTLTVMVQAPTGTANVPANGAALLVQQIA